MLTVLVGTPAPKAGGGRRKFDKLGRGGASSNAGYPGTAGDGS